MGRSFQSFTPRMGRNGNLRQLPIICFQNSSLALDFHRSNLAASLPEHTHTPFLGPSPTHQRKPTLFCTKKPTNERPVHCLSFASGSWIIEWFHCLVLLLI